MTSKAAQVACAQKVAALKAANAEKAAVPPEFIAASFEHQAKAGLEDQHLSTRTKHNHVPAARGPPAALERLNRAKKAAPTRLLCKVEVLAIAGVSFPTIWAWMRDGKFPRARIVGGKSMWLSTEIETWLSALPIRPLKGDCDVRIRETLPRPRGRPRKVKEEAGKVGVTSS